MKSIKNEMNMFVLLTVVPYRVEFVLAPAADPDVNNQPFVPYKCKLVDISDRCCCHLHPNW